jgi:hypothetical protein
MTDEQSHEATPKKARRVQRVQWSLGETTLLAVYTAISYAVAYAFDVGVAEYYGYPAWLVRLDIWSVLLAFGVMLNLTAVVGALVLVLFVFVGTNMKAKTLPILLFTFRVTLALLFMIGCLFFYDRHFAGTVPILSKALRVTMGIFAGMIVWDFVKNFWRARKRDNSSRMEFWDQELLQRGEEATRDSETRERDTLADQIYRHPVAGPTVGLVILSVPLLILFGLVSAGGGFVADQKRIYLVSNDSQPLIAIRSYDGYMITALLDTSRDTLQHSFRIIPVSDADKRVWTPKWVLANSIPAHSRGDTITNR